MSGNTKPPSAEVTVPRTRPVFSDVAVILAVVTAAPVGSTIVPAMVPVGSAPNSRPVQRNPTTLKDLSDISPPFPVSLPQFFRGAIVNERGSGKCGATHSLGKA